MTIPSEKKAAWPDVAQGRRLASTSRSDVGLGTWDTLPAVSDSTNHLHVSPSEIQPIMMSQVFRFRLRKCFEMNSQEHKLGTHTTQHILSTTTLFRDTKPWTLVQQTTFLPTLGLMISLHVYTEQISQKSSVTGWWPDWNIRGSVSSIDQRSRGLKSRCSTCHRMVSGLMP